MKSAIKRAAENAIRKQITESNERYSMWYDALTLFTLYDEFDFSREQLLQFWNAAISNHKYLNDVYKFEDGDMKFEYYNGKLKSIGIDLEELYKNLA